MLRSLLSALLANLSASFLLFPPTASSPSFLRTNLGAEVESIPLCERSTFERPSPTTTEAPDDTGLDVKSRSCKPWAFVVTTSSDIRRAPSTVDDAGLVKGGAGNA